MKTKRDSRKKTGRWGEEKAAEFLKKNGVKIIERNIYNQFGEIDILGEDDHQLVFIEVKTLKTNQFGNPETAVNARKQRHMIDSALLYLQDHDLLEMDWRIDVLAITTQLSGKTDIHWFKNAIDE